jgi:TRAP-type C4-dicarboxylate transport system substrate-binding protein
LQKALDQSKSEFEKQKEKEQEENKPEFFQGKGISLNTNSQNNSFMEIYDSIELKIIKLSLKEVTNSF